MNIYDKNGNVLLNAVLTKSAEHEEELMKSDFIQLSYDDVVGDVLPVDAYIIPYSDGVHYRLFEPYIPEQKNAQKYHYEPHFQHPKMYLGKVPFVRNSYDTQENPITLSEWSYTGFIGTLLQYFCDAINDVFGFTGNNVISYLMVGEFENIVSTTFTAQDILSALSNVANLLECEWHIDWHEKTLFFGHIQIDRQELTQPVLEVDSNIGVPSIRNSKEGYWNAYQPQGSSRNITVRAASGENVQANVRLALNKTQYPDGIIYTDGEGHTLTKAQFEALGLTPYIKSVIYENVYPKLDLFVYDVRYRERYLLDDDGNKVIDHYEGSTPVYKRYAVWFMRLAYPTYNQQGEVTGWTDYTIDPETQVIDGKVLMGAFQANTKDGAETSPLAGQGNGDGEHYGFELAYHETGEIIPPGSDGEGDTGVTIKAGDYEIILQQKDDFIMPSTQSVGMIPKGKNEPSLLGNIVNLYNIVMSDDYLVSAQNELENETLKTIAHDTEDNNSYTFKALETAFEQSNPNLYIGRKVTYRNGDYELRTRVMKLVTKLDYDFDQEITIGNEVLKGNQSTMREKIDTLVTAFAQGSGGLSQNQVQRIIQNWVTPRFLSKLNDDAAQGVITFIRGLISQAYTQFGAGADFGQFVQGLVGGDGARIDEHGNMEATSLVLRSFLEAPKLVYNHVDVRVGDEWQANGAGEIERVVIDTDEQGNELETGTIYLRLLDGEIGTLVGNSESGQSMYQDGCKGIFHNLEGYNDTETKDDGKGGRTFAGFFTSYFTIMGVSDWDIENEDGTTTKKVNAKLRYGLRPSVVVNGEKYWANDDGTSSGVRGGFHPCAHMVFAQYTGFGYGHEERKSCQYRTTTYTRMLSNMRNTWEEGLGNVAFQIGNTPLIASAYNIPDAGRYSLWINGDIYFAGTLNRVDSWGRDVADYPDQGNYFSTIQYHLNDLVHYDGSVWRMAIENEATLGVTPGTSTIIEGQTVYPWVKWIYADSMNPSGKWNHTLVPYAANSIVNIEGKLLISKRSTSQPPIDLLTDENSEPLQTETGEYIVYSDEVNDDWELLFDVGDLTNGKDGQNAIVVNLTNDTDTVLSDEQGNAIGDLPTTTAQLYDGVTLITSGVSWTCQTVGCTATINPQGVVSITAMSADEAKVACIATYNTKTYTKVFTFKKLYGKDKLWLEPSVDKIERYVSGISDNQRSYAYAPTSIRFKAYIQKSGQEPRELTASDGYILLGTNTTHYASGQEINVASVANLFVGNHLPVILKDASGNTQDVEDIVVTEAQDGITSAGAWTYERQIRNNELVSLFGNVYRAKQDSKGVSPVELLTNENNVPLQDENGEYIAYNFNTNTTYYELWIKGSYVIRTEVMYAKGTDGTTTPTSGWSFTKPSVTYGDWLWSRTTVIYSDDNNTDSYSVSYVGTNGIDGKDGENAVQLALAVSPDTIALNADSDFKTGNTLTVKIQKTDGSVTTNIQKSNTATFKLWVGDNGYGISDYNSSTKSYSISLTDKNIQSDSYVHVTYVDGDINLDKSVSITQDGSQGLQGCVTRVSEWKAGVTYKHDAGLALGYIDVVGVRNSSAADGTGWDFYECKKEHTASISNQPPIATYWTEYWTKLNNLGATYTSLLIADNAFIRFGTGNELRIVGSNDKIQAGMRGGTEKADGVRIWAGNIYDGNNNIDLNLAPFRVLQNGKLYATDAYIRGEIHASSGEFTGTITAQSGGITGNFKIGENKAHQYYFEFKPKERAGGTGDYNYYSAQLNGYNADNNKEVFSIKMGELSSMGPTTIGYAPVITMEDSFINPYHFHFEYTINSRTHVTENIMIGGESYMQHVAYKNNVSKTFMSGIVNGVGTIIAQSGDGDNGWATQASQVPIGGVYRRPIYVNDTPYYVLCVRVS